MWWSYWTDRATTNPVWNWSSRTFKKWTIDNYPAFKACNDLWTWWRLPTIDELSSLYNNNNWCVSTLSLGSSW
jgi:hypothetical protein